MLFAVHAEELTKEHGLRDFEQEYRFHPKRRFRIDFAWPEIRLAVELHGAIWKIGRHQRPQGFQNDCIKRRLLVSQGWWLLEFVTSEVEQGIAKRETSEQIERLMEAV